MYNISDLKDHFYLCIKLESCKRITMVIVSYSDHIYVKLLNVVLLLYIYIVDLEFSLHSVTKHK